MKRYENLEEAMCRELEKLNKKYGGETAEMNAQDVERADTLYHALKCAETYHAMKDAAEMDADGMDGSGDMRGYRRSYARRGRDAMGRYTSREMDHYSGTYPEWAPGYYPMHY